jgi:hypothetical protein
MQPTPSRGFRTLLLFVAIFGLSFLSNVTGSGAQASPAVTNQTQRSTDSASAASASMTGVVPKSEIPKIDALKSEVRNDRHADKRLKNAGR